MIPAHGTITPQKILKVKEPGNLGNKLVVLSWKPMVLWEFWNTQNWSVVWFCFFFKIPGMESMVIWIWFSQNAQKKKVGLWKIKKTTQHSSFLWSFFSWWIDDSGFLCLGLSEMKCYCKVKEAKYSMTAENMFLYMGYPSISIYEGWRKVVCLFCLYRWNPPNQDASDGVLGLFGKFSRRRGALAWFHGVWTSWAKVLEYWMISSLKIKLN